MTDDELRDRFARLELRLERLDTKVESLEKGLADVRAELRPRLEGLENRLARKADTWVVTVGMGGLGLLLTIYKFFV
jgi:uncharacterized protein YlxW (UPF0749 family)